MSILPTSAFGQGCSAFNCVLVSAFLRAGTLSKKRGNPLSLLGRLLFSELGWSLYSRPPMIK